MAYADTYAAPTSDPSVVEIVVPLNDATLDECMSRNRAILADLALEGIAGLPGALDQIAERAAAGARRSARRYVLFLG